MQSHKPSRSEDETELNKALVLKFYESANQELRRDLLSPDLVGRSPGVPPFGRDGFLRGIADLTDAFPDGVYTNDEIIAEGDQVVTVGRFHGTHLKPFHGAPPTGKPVTFVAVHVDRVANGKIVEHLRVSAPDGSASSRSGVRGDSQKASP